MSEERYQQRQQQLKERVEQRVAEATKRSGIVIVFTGNGKGKTSAAFGTAARAIGHGMKVGVVQFIKGGWESGERNLLERAGAEFHIMATGFTWDTQDKLSDTRAAVTAWEQGKRMLADPAYGLVILDEMTYMLTYGYLALDEVLTALENRPAQQNVVITGRACHRDLIALADTVSELRPIKHAFDSGIQAQAGIDW